MLIVLSLFDDRLSSIVQAKILAQENHFSFYGDIVVLRGNFQRGGLLGNAGADGSGDISFFALFGFLLFSF